MYKNEELREQKYKEAKIRAQKKYVEKTYQRMTAIVRKEIYEKVLLSDKYKNNNQYINELIMDDLKKQGLIDNNENIDTI